MYVYFMQMCVCIYIYIHIYTHILGLGRLVRVGLQQAGPRRPWRDIARSWV